MFLRSIRLNVVVSLLFVLLMGACSGFGGCGGCGGGPLPAGGVPVSQTVEGGAQIRVTPSGFTKLKDIVPALANTALNGGFCVAQQNFGFNDPIFGSFTGIRACTSSVGGCNPGCRINVTVPSQGITVTPIANTNLIRVNVAVNAAATAEFRAVVLGAGVGTCTMTAQSSSLGGSFDIALGVKANNGELDIKLDKVNAFTLGLNFSGCGFASDVLDFVSDVVDSFVGQFLVQLLSPLINNVLQNFLPNPLGIANMMNVGSLLEGVSPGTDGYMEARIVPGGYATVANGGVNLGVITALNADEDPSTRGVGLASEPHLCVPPLPGPDFSQLGLGSVYRSSFNGNTYSLLPAGQFSGSPDPTIPNKTVDMAMGISETTLDLAGHHLVTSGGMCLGIGTSFIAQLNVGTIGILVPSLAELQTDEGNDPLLLVTRPQRAIDFTIGDNTTASPALTMHLQHLEVDFYAFIWERYVRAFTLDLTMNVGINLEFETTGTTTVIKPSLVGISSSEVTVKVINSQFVRETAQHLEGVLPSVFDLVTPLLGTLPDIPVPAFGGLSVNPLKVTKVTTSQDDFLALYAQLGSSPMMRQVAQQDLNMAQVVEKMDDGIPAQQAPAAGRVTLLDVDTPAAGVIRDALTSNNGALPTVSFEVERFDAQGRELEWTWNINGGFWRPYTSVNPLVISDKTFAWQGKYEIGLKSRVKGNFRTTSEIVRQKVTIDSVGPTVFGEKSKWDGDQLTVPAWDVVGGRDFEVAWGEMGEDGPATNWVPYRGATLARASAMKLAEGHNGEIVMYARDEQGNVTATPIAPFHGQAGAAGCACETTGRPGVGSLLLMGLVGFGLLRRRRRTEWPRRFVAIAASRTARTVVMFVGVIALSALVPACSCGDTQGQSCETAADCGPDFCDEGQLPFCIDNTCVCSDDIPAGRIGPYSDVAFGGGQIWVSAYASSHGDLVVANTTGGRIPNEAWEWVDGVPDGPVIVPDSEIRGGIDEAGADVGLYTSIAVAADGTPMVSYFDRTTASLKFAARVGGVWQTHQVQIGTSQIDPGAGGSLIGMYTSLTLRSDDGRPGIAYLAHVADTAGMHAEVRYAAAQTAFPTQASDWTTWVVDTALIPENPDEIYPLPGGLGLFVDSARNPMNQAPVVVYYDRANGDLKLARFNPSSGQFATPILLDGSGSIDAGWSPAVQVDDQGVAHVVYVSATGDDLKYTTDAMGAMKETVDDGYRIVGTTVDGLPKPEFHFVGDDANLILVPGGVPTVVYQDATTQEMLVAQKGTNGMWNHVTVAGASTVAPGAPWPGAWGFFASGTLGSTEIVMSSWVIDQPNNDNWVEVLSKPFSFQ